MYRNLLIDDYYLWLSDMIDGYMPAGNYSKVLEELFSKEFYALIEDDNNRAEHGFELRTMFSDDIGEHLYFVMDELPDYCTVLEMMVALARRWEDTIAWDPDKGDRTSQWFWIMMENLGLTKFDNRNFDKGEVDNIIYILLERKYERDGTGGLFKIKRKDIDMRKTEIWYQMNFFFNENIDLV